MIDFVSIGSVTQADLQRAQYATFGKSVRYFYAATEADDVEQNCSKALTWDHVQTLVRRCNSKHKFPLLNKLGGLFGEVGLKSKSNPSGWICAQKRPLHAFRNAVHKYYHEGSESSTIQSREDSSNNSSPVRFNVSLLPDYLVLGDDDTWINIGGLKSSLPKMYPSDQARVIAGYLIRFGHKRDFFTIPHGGFGSVFTRATLVNLLRPITCYFNETNQTDTTPVEATPPFSNQDDFDALVCWRLQQNMIGELDVYRPGMSLLDMMHEYSIAAPYLKATQKGIKFFCLHSDWVWGYMVNYYHMARHSIHNNATELQSVYKTWGSTALHNRIEDYNHSQNLAALGNSRGPFLGQCRNSNDYNSFKPTIQLVH